MNGLNGRTDGVKVNTVKSRLNLNEGAQLNWICFDGSIPKYAYEMLDRCANEQQIPANFNQ